MTIHHGPSSTNSWQLQALQLQIMLSEYYNNTNQSFDYADGQVTASYGTATPKLLESSTLKIFLMVCLKIELL